MAFIGNTNTTQAFTPAIDYFSGNGSTTAFTLSRPVASVAQVQAVVNNVAQNPSSAYTVSGNTITFTSAPSSGTNNIYVYYTSPITQVVALPQNPQVFGNLQFSSSGARITGDFSNATVANRVMFQTSTTNGNTVLNLIPNGTGTICAFNMDSDPVLTNSSTCSLNLIASTEVRLNSAIRGTGTYLPMTFYTGGSERMRVDTSGNVGVGQTSQVWDEKLGVRPSGTSTVGIGVYSASTSYTGSIFRAQAENATGANFKLYEGRGSGGSVNYWVDGAGSAYFAGNLQFNSGYGSVATAYGCRAWVNFNGTGVVAIRASGNVTSITDNGVGDYTVNFTTAMPDANYSSNISNSFGSTYCFVMSNTTSSGTISAPTTSAMRFAVLAYNASTFQDCQYLHVAIYR